MKNQSPITQTEIWLNSTVIALNLCPFAKHPFQSGTIRYIEANTKDTEEALLTVHHELTVLHESSPEDIETTLIILSEGWAELEDYLSLIDIAQQLLEQMELEGVIQIASFHPQYQFDNLNKDDVRNYTNRSPYPMIHLLREASVTLAVDSHPDIDSIPQNNQKRLLKLGIDHFKR